MAAMRQGERRHGESGPPARDGDDAETPYLRHLTALGDRRPVTATEDIVNEAGAKVLASGYRINSALLARLLQHKLARPIDSSCVMDNAIGEPELRERGAALLATQPLVQAQVERHGQAAFLDTCFGHAALPTALRNKLTVLAEQTPGLFDHSLWCCMGCVLLGLETGLADSELQSLALAALLHDIGQLHIDQRILDPREPLDDPLRRQVRSHPVVGSSIVEALGGFDPAVPRAVLEHHERSDGSGYPRGLSGDAISRGGRILSLVEFSLGVLQSAGSRHLIIVLKTYAHQFDPALTRALWARLPLAALPDDYPFDTAAVPALFARLSAVVDGWEAVQGSARADPWVLAERDFAAIRQACARIGLTGGLIEQLAQGPGDAESCREVNSVLREGLRQAREVIEQLSSAAQTDRAMQRDSAALVWLEDCAEQFGLAK